MENNNQTNESKLKGKDIGALWLKKSQKTNASYLTGSVKLPSGEVIKILVFKNNYKNSPNQPDYRIFPDEKAPAAEVPQKQSKPKEPVANNSVELEDEEIPF
jgi:uncharacterized protein (DUF736 family)